LPIPRTNKPLKHAAPNSRPRGNAIPRSNANRTNRPPYMMYRTETSVRGGKLSSDIRMPR
jgi:hypothetical protein